MNELLANPSYNVFDGESRAHTRHWIGNLQVMGQLDTTVTANAPLAVAFKNADGLRSYVAFNVESGVANITFSDGFTLEVDARSLGYEGRVDPNTVSIDSSPELAKTVELFAAYPNPFNPSTTIGFQLPESAVVRLDVFTVSGQRVATLVNTELASGSHQVTFNATGLASGIYIYRLQTPMGQFSRTITLMK